MSSSSSSKKQKQIPDEFKKIIFEFLGDISNTFPEYKNTLGLFLNSSGININVQNAESESESDTQKVVQILYEYCSKVYPERFFDILYKNDKIFMKTTSECANVNAHFLPNIDFSVLWNTEGISDTTRETIWKYLQLILMTVITNIEDRKSFGDAANLFEAINEDELRNKLEETIQQMYNMFEGANANGGEDASSSQPPGSEEFNFFDWAKNMNKTGDGNAEEPNANANAESIHDHISQILNGKIGKLAKEIAEETAKDVDFNADFGGDGDGENGENMDFKNVFQKMFKNPGKLMSLVKNVGSKLDQKFKSGEIKESELMQEASDLLGKMKGMPGMNNLADMLNKMGMGGMMGGMGGNSKSKVNVGAMQSHLQRNMKQSQTKERLQQKLKAQQQQRDAALSAAAAAAATTTQVFSTGEVVDRTPIDASRPSNSNSNKKKKKK
jgi:hypothetical protein